MEISNIFHIVNCLLLLNYEAASQFEYISLTSLVLLVTRNLKISLDDPRTFAVKVFPCGDSGRQSEVWWSGFLAIVEYVIQGLIFFEITKQITYPATNLRKIHITSEYVDRHGSLHQVDYYEICLCLHLKSEIIFLLLGYQLTFRKIP